MEGGEVAQASRPLSRGHPFSCACGIGAGFAFAPLPASPARPATLLDIPGTWMLENLSVPFGAIV